MDLDSANPSVVKSIKQRDLLNTWLRLYARDRLLPRIEEHQPERLTEELPDLVYYTVDAAEQPPRQMIQSDGTRMSSGFKLDNLMDVKRDVPTRIVNAVIDLELARRPAGVRACDDIVESNQAVNP